jgi:anti-sigma regulatory factor (Ser/Thr protein kinase)
MPMPKETAPAELRLKISHDYSAVRGAACEVRKFLASQGLPEKEIWACELAMVEGCNNAVQYVEQSARAEKISLEVSCSPEEVKLKIADNTRGFDLPDKIDLPEVEEESGRGLYLIKSLMDQVEYVRDRASNYLVLQKDRSGI